MAKGKATNGSAPKPALNLHTEILTEGNWTAFETLFGKHGAVGGCWCMYWRLPRVEYSARSGEGNRQAFRQIVQARKPAGILAFDDENPVGWAAVAPRSDYGTLDRSRILKPVDDLPVWSIPCFYIAKGFRRRGVMQALIQAAEVFARENGATILEGYPVEAGERSMVDTFVYTGLAAAFRKSGFEEVARRSETRPIMRKNL